MLTLDEAVRVWAAAESIGMWGDIVRLLLLTAARRGEVLSMRWADVDVLEGLWRIPGEARKGGEAHVLPLVGQALAIVRAQRRRGEWVFPAPTDTRQHATWPQQQATKLRQLAGVDCRIHDLRRTVASHLAAAGVSSDVIEAILGHSRPLLVRTYQRYSPLREMRRALEGWENALCEERHK